MHPSYNDLYEIRVFNVFFMFFYLLFQKKKTGSHERCIPPPTNPRPEISATARDIVCLLLVVILSTFGVLHISLSICVSFLFTRLSEVIKFILGWLTVRRDSGKAAQHWEGSSSFHTNRSSDWFTQPHCNVFLVTGCYTLVEWSQITHHACQDFCKNYFDLTSEIETVIDN